MLVTFFSQHRNKDFKITNERTNKKRKEKKIKTKTKENSDRFEIRKREKRGRGGERERDRNITQVSQFAYKLLLSTSSNESFVSFKINSRDEKKEKKERKTE